MGICKPDTRKKELVPVENTFQTGNSTNLSNKIIQKQVMFNLEAHQKIQKLLRGQG